jgi:hypothetical protein
MENKYNRGKIYKIVSPHTDKIYIGSSCKKYLAERKADHKYQYKKWLNRNGGYCSSFDLFGLGDIDIVLLENVNCNTKDELYKKEQEYLDKFKNIAVNINSPMRKKKEIITL